MAKQQTSTGVCQICQREINKSSMTRHLGTCLAAHEKAESTEKKGAAKKVRFLRIFAEGRYNPQYWLYVEMAATAPLSQLDHFLRGIWLECCGHLSAFEIEGVYFDSDKDSDDEENDSEERSMGVRVGQVLQPGMKFTYEYDFGSTTSLAMRVVGEREGQAPKTKDPVRLLARNDPPQILCAKCKKPAVWVDVARYSGCYCEKCIEDTEEGVLPVVNSPRVGVCGYTGD